jgi:hypothetical protein
MPQKPLDASDETVRLTLRLTMSQTHGLDELRGKTSRSEYLRELIDLAIGQKTLREAYPDERPVAKVKMIRVEPIKKVVPPEECSHTWERAGSIFDRCTKCDARKRH